jgi:hypothetical protein
MLFPVKWEAFLPRNLKLWASKLKRGGGCGPVIELRIASGFSIQGFWKYLYTLSEDKGERKDWRISIV